MNSIRLLINNTGLEFDRDYGASHRTGWSVLKGGSVRIQFVGFLKACWTLFRVLREVDG